MEGNPVLDVHCSTCGAAVQFNILRQVYNCTFCGSVTPTGNAIAEKKGFREKKLQQIKSCPPGFSMRSGTCNSCGAKVLFPENEAMTQCAFCGKSIVSKDYLKMDDFPELLIPFYLTKEDAVNILGKWCKEHSTKSEARILKDHVSELQGVYLPYEIAKGPVAGKVNRDSTRRELNVRGFVDGIFVNASKGIDNLLLNGMEPYDLRGVREMDFSYLAGSTVKVRDISGQDLEKRIGDEIAYDYEGHLVKTMETRAFGVKVDTSKMMQMSALLPVYFINVGDVQAAVNGQTGKVAVRERKDRFLLPWWLKPIFATLLLSALTFLIIFLVTGNPGTAGVMTAMLGVYFLIVTFAAYSDYSSPRWRLRRRIFTSSGGPYVRQGEQLVQQGTPLPESVPEPQFVEIIGDAPRIVTVKYSAKPRIALMLFLTIMAILIPAIIAFAAYGTAWAGFAFMILCITVPVAPIYYVKFARLELYEHPWIYFTNGRGQKCRYHGKKK
ncbi:MAG: hypothetical protein IK020_02260 [Clostridiales bacterium]|nr:hypothetical protein [Clostridiales bacterium]